MATYAPTYEGSINSDTTYGTVTGWLNTLNQYAQQSIVFAGQAANNLNTLDPVSFSPSIVFQTVTEEIVSAPVNRPLSPTFTPSSTNTPSQPSLSATQVVLREPGDLVDIIPPDVQLVGLPTSPSISIDPLILREFVSSPSFTLPTIQLNTVPDFTESDPSLNLPSVPSPLSLVLPTRDFTINTDLVYPDAPDTSLIPVPTLLELSIPTAETLNLPTFSLDFPSSSSLVPPGITFGFNEDSYSSNLLTKVSTILLDRLSDHTGLPPEVEEALWNRGRDREQRGAVLSERSLLVDRTSQGFTRPSGATQAALNQIVQETQGKIIDLSREIMIKQADMMQENIKTSIQQVISLEDILIRNNQQTIQRAFEIAKYLQDIQIEIFKIEVSKYNSEVEAYKAFAEAYNSKVRAELSKIEIFRAKLEGEKVRNEINTQNIQLYTAKIDAVRNNVEIYKALISTVLDKLKAEELKLTTYRTDIEAYSEGVKAKSIEYQSYSDQIKGEMTKTEIFDSKVKAYASKVQAYSSINDSIIKKAEVEGTLQQLLLDKFKSELSATTSINDSLIKKSGIDLNTQELLLKEYETSINSISSLNDSTIKKAGIDTDIQELLLKSYEAKLNADNSINESKLKKAGLNVNIQELLVKAYESQLEAYIKDRQAEQLKFQSSVDLYKAQSSIYLADQEVEKNKAEIKLKAMENTIVQNKYAADIAIENAKLALANAKNNADLFLEGTKSAGSIYQAIASSALSAINVSAQVQAQNSVSYNENLSLAG